MKFSIIFFLLTAFTGLAQVPKLTDLIALQTKPPQEIKAYFSEAGWQLADERFSEKRDFGDMTFISQQSGKAPIRAKIFYGLNKESQTRIQLFIKDKDQFTALKSGIQGSDLRFSTTEAGATVTSTVFKNEKVTLRILAERPVGSAVSYEVVIESNEYDPKMYNFSLGK